MASSGRLRFDQRRFAACPRIHPTDLKPQKSLFQTLTVQSSTLGSKMITTTTNLTVGVIAPRV